jgi:hypothetical protein
MGALGSGLTPRQNRRLTSHAPRLPLRAIPPFGKTVTLAWQIAGALFARVSRTAAGIVIETGGSSVVVATREGKMPIGRGGDHGTRERMVCPRCGSSRDALHWVAEVGWGCRGADCLDLAFPVRHQQRWCPAIRRRAKLLRKLVRVSPRGLKARWLREQIAREERAMLANLKRANRALAKRRQRRAQQRRANPGQ